MAISTRLTPFVLAMLGALLLWASFPPADLWPLAWVAPVPWVVLIRRENLAGRRPYLAITFAGFCFWMGTLHWLRLPHLATSIGWVALSFCFAFYLPLFVGISRVAVHRLNVPVILAAPVVWTGLELVRGHFLTGMTMASLGHTQYRFIDLIQLGDLAGAYGVGFVVMLVAASAARMFSCGMARWAVWPIGIAIVVVGAAVFYGRVRMETYSPSPGPQVALIQGSVDIKFSESFEEYDAMRNRISTEYSKLSRKAIDSGRKIELVVWPESMFYEPLITFDKDAAMPPDFPGTKDDFRKWISENQTRSTSLLAGLAKSLDVPLLVGANVRHFGPRGERSLASAVFVGRDGRLLGRYDKIHLVMFGEYIPFADRIPWLYRLTPLTGSATPGDGPAAFELGGVRMSPSICYENVLPHVICRQVNALAAEGREPDVLVNLTNDGWFWGSSELDLHLMCAVFRAVECRKPMLIAANTGFSASIDANGRILEKGPRRDKGVIFAMPQLDRSRRSWYLANGDWFAGFCLTLTTIWAAVGIRWRRQSSGKGKHRAGTEDTEKTEIRNHGCA